MKLNHIPLRLAVNTGLSAHTMRPNQSFRLVSREPKLINEAPNQLGQSSGGTGLGNEKSRCAMIGCKRPFYRALAIAPGTVVELCAEHFAAEKGDLEAQKTA